MRYIALAALLALVSGAPASAQIDARMFWFAEGHSVNPDIPLEDDPSQLAKGTDAQLQRAIQEVTTRMKALPPKPAQPPYEKRVPGSGQ